MSISYENADGGEVIATFPRGLAALLMANTIFAGFVVFGWKLIWFFAQPAIEWATWMPIYRGSSLDDLFTYPFLLLWLWPLAGAGAAWLAIKSRKRSLAYSFAGLPVLMLSMVFIAYYLSPPDWR